MNFRDVGGLPAANGETRSGVLFRSGNLARIGDAGIERMRGLGIERIIDLRADDEVARDVTPDTGITVERIPLFLGSVASFFQEDQSLSDMYRAMISESADRVVAAVRSLTQAKPLLVHCTVGKDRTGVAVALTLAAAGVEEEAIIADYARTESMLPPERNRNIVEMLAPMYPDMKNLIELTTLSPAPVMRGLLAELTQQYGAPVEYLRASGLTDDEIAALRKALIQ